ncbi:uncharacterized protein LOC130669944 [Microplitis mediator]|uniref:uncharacterized protein LOC130669944 n=1 Tax=Microplitis mediator TaxID=375433 RepID=UPI0025561982|nr:uncharacterized protein LOC130669944 [Microplitis mediator]
MTENNLKSEEPFPKYYDNFIAKRADDYYCNLCENNYSSSNLIIEHTEDAVHRNLLIHEKRSRGIVTDTSLSSEFCKLFVENNIFGSESVYLECYSCKVTIPVDKSTEHINRLSHKAKHSLFLAKVDKSDTDVGNDDQKYPDYIRFKYKNDDEKVLTCFICSIKQLWKEHQKDTEHRCRARFFFKNFTDIPGDVVCMLCKKTIPKGSVIDHAGNEHQLMPWYRPVDEFVSYFKNFILPMGYKYYCYLCDKVFCRWYLSLEHTEDARHLKLVKELIKDKDINNQLLSPDFCEQLSANSIYPVNFKQLRCWACQYVIDGYETASEHIDCDDHTIKLREKKSELLSKLYKTSNNWRK